MGRELRRKEEKRNKNKITKNTEELDTGIRVSTAIKIILFSTIILLAVYYVVAVFVTKEIDISWTNEDEATDTANEGTTNRILAKNIFNQKEDKYYIYFYDFTDEDMSINSAINNSELIIYRVDTNSALNQNYVTEDAGNRNATGIDNLKVKNPTIIEINNDKITGYYEGSSEILGFIG